MPTAIKDDFYSFFSDTPINQVTLYVPKSSLDSYKSTKPWSGFGTILPISPTGIENKTTVKSDVIDAIYDLGGKICNGTQHGLNIMRMTDGTIKKVMR